MLFMAARSGELDSWSPSYGSVRGRPDVKVARLTEEIGILALDDPSNGVGIGDRLEILPNHISLAVNLHDRMYGIRSGAVEREIAITCRGLDY
jgi:D-serine deaminase-like pyridoxal phosphate-dependent protein